MERDLKIAIVTGAGSGIGRAASEALIARGWRVYDFSRRDRAAEGVCHVDCDIACADQVKAAVDEVLGRERKIDLVVNNAGFGISGAIEFTRAEDALRLLNVNLMGADNMCKCAIPHMRARGSGRVINISSVAAALPIPFQAWYSASKAAINAYTLALRNEVAPFGVSVCSVMPGDIHTGFTAAREKAGVGDDVYAGRIGRAVSAMERDELHGMKPERVGRFIARISERKRVKPLYAVGAKYRWFVVLSRLLPVRFVNYVLGRLYGS